MFNFLEEVQEKEPETREDLKPYSITPRSIICAPKGKVLSAVDYKNQELYFIAVLSEDQNMLKAFTLPEKYSYIDSNGNTVEYKNPEADLHTMTAKECCFPYLFENQPFEKWSDIARDKTVLKNLLGDPRKYGKITNFAIVYLATAKTMAENNYLKLEIAEEWIKRHKKIFPDCHKFTEQEKEIAEARGWAANSYNRIRWCREDNSKGQGASTGRSGVNFKIQSLGAELSKKAIIALEKEFRGEPCNLLALIHDEVLIEHPGKAYLKPKEKNGVYYLNYEIDEEADYWRKRAKKVLEDEESKMLNYISGSEEYVGMCEVDTALFWSH